MSTESKNEDVHVHEQIHSTDTRSHGVYQIDTLDDKDLMNEAFQGENAEHEMGLWESAKAHPMACVWAFIFCFTIVSLAKHISQAV